MSINQIIYRNLRKNMRHYSLYMFALIFSAGLYFAFVTLQYDPAMDDATGSIKGAAGLKAASVLLVIIVSVFLLYANNLFIKRRGREIGLFQLIGMTKGMIFRILSVENFILYFGSLAAGIFLGFAVSRLLMLILIKVTGVDGVATLRFSGEAFVQTLIVFTFLYVLIMVMNFVFIKRQSILSLFRVTTTAQQRVKKMSYFQVFIGILGIALILFGYYLSSRLFDAQFIGSHLFLAMIAILGSVILGTYLFYKGSVSFIFNLIRKQKEGYVTVRDVLSLTSIMFRMKSNSFLLTVITTLSALAIGLLSLSYISYYSAEKTAQQNIPDHFSIPNAADAQRFTEALDNKGIGYTVKGMDLLEPKVDLSNVIVMSSDIDGVMFDVADTTMVTVSDAAVPGVDVGEKEVVFVDPNKVMEKLLSFKSSGQVTFSGEKTSYDLHYKGMKNVSVVPTRLTGGFPTAIVDQEVFAALAKDPLAEIQPEFTEYVGVNIKDEKQLEKADDIFRSLDLNIMAGYESRQEETVNQKMNVGLLMFIVGFLGLAFLVTSGCILYFKQVDESEDEKPGYTILRKLGFTQADLISGIKRKQLFNFGIPLLIGVSHSYFAVKSGWFFFGTELIAPTIMVMLLYTILYSIFGLLSVLYYKRVIKAAL